MRMYNKNVIMLVPDMKLFVSSVLSRCLKTEAPRKETAIHCNNHRNHNHNHNLNRHSKHGLGSETRRGSRLPNVAVKWLALLLCNVTCTPIARQRVGK
jgi:hypothetical protein